MKEQKEQKEQKIQKKQKEERQLKIKKADVIFIFIILFISFLTVIFYRMYYQENGVWVVVYQNGTEIDRYDLGVDGIYLENNTNTIEIKDGKVDMIDSDCKNQICVNHIPIEKVGETIVCLPNKIVVVIEGEQEENTLDSIVN